MGNYYLMQKDIPLLSFDLEENNYEIIEPDLLPYAVRGRIKPVDSNFPLKEQLKILIQNRDIMVSFLARRTLTMSRQNAKQILNAFAYTQSQTDADRAAIAIDCGAVCCGDKYWIKRADEDINWNEADPAKNDSDKKMIQISLFGKSLTPGRRFKTPELTTQGSYAKAWIKEDGVMFLYKRSGRENEADIEVEVSTLLDCFNVNHVSYESVLYEGERMCRCRNMADDSHSVVTAEELYHFCDGSEKRFMDLALSIDAPNIYKMCIIDYLISNSDRHMQNWGFCQAVETGELTGCHPLFDHNRAFDEVQMKEPDGGESLVFRGQSKRDAARFAVSRCDLHLTKIIQKEMFFSEIHFESFMDRMQKTGIK